MKLNEIAERPKFFPKEDRDLICKTVKKQAGARVVFLAYDK